MSRLSPTPAKRFGGRVVRQAIGDAVASISLVNLLYLDTWRLLFLVATPTAFFLTLRRWDYLAAGLGVVVIGSGLACLAIAGRRAPQRIRRLLCLVALATLVLLGDALRKHQAVDLPALVRGIAAFRVLGLPAIALIALTTAVLAWCYARPLARAYRLGLILASPFVVVTLSRAAWIASTTDFSRFADVVAPAAGPPAPGLNRVVAIVFDELDNEIAFTKRPKDLLLPQLDSFRAGAISFDSASPPAPNTAESMFSYLLGARVKQLRPVGARTFRAELLDGRIATDTNTTLFERLHQLGAHSGMVGFYLPYCRLRFAVSLARCAWLPFVNGGAITGLKRGVASSFASQTKSLFPLNNRLAHIERFRLITAQASALAADSSLEFVLVHFPAPHLPPIYNRRRKAFRITVHAMDGYLDNVALADVALGEIRAAMQDRHVWESTLVIVTADHSWREKEMFVRSSDRRIPFIVKLPNASRAGTVRSPINSIVLDRLVVYGVKGSINDSETLCQAVFGTSSRP